MTSTGLNSGEGIEGLRQWLRGDDSRSAKQAELDARVQAAREALAGSDDAAHLHELASELDAWASEQDDAQVACAGFLHASALAEAAHEPDVACEYAERALELDPTDEAPLAVLERLLTEQGDVARLESMRAGRVRLLEERAPFESELRIAALCSLAELRAGELSDLDAAIDAYREAIEIDAQESTMQSAAQLLLQRNQPGDADDAAELYFQLADRADAEEAQPFLELALDAQPDHERAIEALKQLTELDGEDHEQQQRLMSRMVAFASVAPAGHARDSIVEELRARNSDVDELDRLTGESAAPDAAPAAVAAAEPVAPAPAAVPAEAAAVRPDGTVSYERERASSPAVGVVAASTGEPASGADAASPQTGSTLPFRTQAVEPVRAAVSPGVPEPDAPKASKPWLWLVAAFAVALLGYLSFSGDDEAQAPGTAASASTEPLQPESQEVSAAAATAAQADPAPAPSAEPAAPNGEPAAPQAAAGKADEDKEATPPVVQAPPAERAKPSRAAKGPRERSIGGATLQPSNLTVQRGRMDAAVLFNDVEAVQRKLAVCYGHMRRGMPKLRGSMRLEWEVLPGGRVGSVRALGGNLRAKKMQLCGFRALRVAHFTPPAAGKAVVRARFDFAPPT